MVPNSNDDDNDCGEFASPPCFMHEFDQVYNDAFVDPRQALDVARWRNAERKRLIAARLSLSVIEHTIHAKHICRQLDEIVKLSSETIISMYWPFRGEPDLRTWMTALYRRGGRVALPVVVSKEQPLIFREWLPGMRLERGVWNIPYPADGAVLVPTVVDRATRGL